MGVQYFGDEKKNTYEPINQKGISRATVQEFFFAFKGTNLFSERSISISSIFDG